MHDSAARLVPPASAEERIREDMPASNIFPVLASILGLWGVGIFLVSPRHDQVVRREIRIFGGTLIGVSLVLLALLFGTRPDNWLKSQFGLNYDGLDWWPVSELQDPVSAIAFVVFAMGGASSAILAVFAASEFGCIRWFALFLAFCSGLFAFHDAMIPSGIGLMIAGALFGLTSRLAGVDRSTIPAAGKTRSVGSSSAGRDPAFTAFCGFLIATSLCGAVSYALVHESGASGLNAETSRLTYRFLTPAEIETESNTSDENHPKRAVDGWNLLFGEYWILLFALLALVVCVVSGFILIRRQTNIMTSGIAAARPLDSTTVGDLR